MSEHTYREATRPDVLQRWHGLLAEVPKVPWHPNLETLTDEIAEALDHAHGLCAGTDARERADAATSCVDERGEPVDSAAGHCAVDGHYLTIRCGRDGSMRWTRHIDPVSIARLDQVPFGGPAAVQAYRTAGLVELAEANPATDLYVITPPAAASVSAPTAITWRRRAPSEAYAEQTPWRPVRRDDGDGERTVSLTLES